MCKKSNNTVDTKVSGSRSDPELALMLGIDLGELNAKPESDFVKSYKVPVKTDVKADKTKPEGGQKTAGGKKTETHLYIEKKRALNPVEFLTQFLEKDDILKKMKYFSMENTFYVYDQREGYWVAMGARVFETSMQQVINAIEHLKGFISPAVFTRTLVSELKGTEIHSMYVPEFDMNHLCLKNCLVNTTDGSRSAHTPEVFLTSGAQYS